MVVRLSSFPALAFHLFIAESCRKLSASAAAAVVAHTEPRHVDIWLGPELLLLLVLLLSFWVEEEGGRMDGRMDG